MKQVRPRADIWYLFWVVFRDRAIRMHPGMLQALQAIQQSQGRARGAEFHCRNSYGCGCNLSLFKQVRAKGRYLVLIGQIARKELLGCIQGCSRHCRQYYKARAGPGELKSSAAVEVAVAVAVCIH